MQPQSALVAYETMCQTQAQMKVAHKEYPPSRQDYNLYESQALA